MFTTLPEHSQIVRRVRSVVQQLDATLFLYHLIHVAVIHVWMERHVYQRATVTHVPAHPNTLAQHVQCLLTLAWVILVRTMLRVSVMVLQCTRVYVLVKLLEQTVRQKYQDHVQPCHVLMVVPVMTMIHITFVNVHLVGADWTVNSNHVHVVVIHV